MKSLAMSRSICDNLGKDCLVANAAPNANPMQCRPFSLIWNLLSRLIDPTAERRHV
jgi:hypothetical protein